MRRRVLFSLWLLCVPSVAGCGKPQPRAAATIESRSEKSVRPSYLDRLEMPRRQRIRVNAELSRLYAAFDEYDVARLVLLDAVVEQVRKGELSREELEPLAKTTVDAFDRGYPTLLSAANQIHALLTPAQRKELMALLVHAEEEQTPEAKREARQERLAQVLDLTTAQKTRLYPSMAVLAVKHWGLLGHYRGGIQEAREAFLGEDFDARQLALGRDPRVWDVAEAFFEALETALRVLNADQRRTLASLMLLRYS